MRKSSIVAPVDRTLRTLQRLEADGSLDEFTVGVWPGEVRLDETPPHADVVELFEEFDAWADQWNVSIRPPFAVETRRSEITGETREVLLTPVQCLAVYVNGVLTEVFPHTADPRGEGETYTVADALALFEARDIRAFGSPSPDTPPDERTTPGRPAEGSLAAESDLCPTCGARLVTGQGVYACSACDWTVKATGPGRFSTVGTGTAASKRPGSSSRWTAGPAHRPATPVEDDEESETPEQRQ